MDFIKLIMEAFDCLCVTTFITSKAHVKTHERCLLACDTMKVVEVSIIQALS